MCACTTNITHCVCHHHVQILGVPPLCVPPLCVPPLCLPPSPTRLKPPEEQGEEQEEEQQGVVNVDAENAAAAWPPLGARISAVRLLLELDETTDMALQVGHSRGICWVFWCVWVVCTGLCVLGCVYILHALEYCMGHILLPGAAPHCD